MIAMALICDPALLIADEPTTALDVTIQAQVLGLLKSLQREREMGLLLITHDLGVVANMADEVVVIYHGEVMEAGPVEAIFRKPRHPYLKALIGCRSPLRHEARRTAGLAARDDDKGAARKGEAAPRPPKPVPRQPHNATATGRFCE